MSHNNVAATRVVAVLLADGWHHIVPGSFRVGPLSFEAEAGRARTGLRLEAQRADMERTSHGLMPAVREQDRDHPGAGHVVVAHTAVSSRLPERW